MDKTGPGICPATPCAKESDNHSPLLGDENWDAYFDSWRTKNKSV
jgi:hypothetical protein